MSPPQQQQQQQPRPTTGPPRLAEALLRLSVRDRNARDGLLGDLQEEYTRLTRSGAFANRPRWAWYGLAVLGLSGRFLLARLPGAGGAGSRPPTTGDAKGRTPMIDTLLKDLRYAFRTLGKSPAFTAVVVFSLGLGIGATSTIFSALNPILLRPLPFADPDRLVAICENSEQRPGARRIPRAGTIGEWIEHNQAFEQLEFVGSYTETWTYPGIDGAERNATQYLSPGLFRLLGVEPILGRNFAEDVGNPRTSGDDLILSYGFWQRRFGGDPDIVGQTWANVGTVVGVMPPGFRIFSWNEADFWTQPLDIEELGVSRWMEPIGRLKRGVSKEGAQTQLDGIASRLDQSGVSAESGWRVKVESLHERWSRLYASNLYLLMGAAVLLLLIACSNVASLLVGRATNRHREITTRAALGAGRLRLMRQMLTESVVLALLGGALGVLMAQVGTRLFVILAPTAGWYLPAKEIHVDGMVLGFALGLSLLTVVLFGMVPALRASKPDLAVSLKEGARGSAGGSRPLVHNLLVGSQIALTFVLLAGAALMINSLVRLVAVDRGFKPERLLTAQVRLGGERYVTWVDRDGREFIVVSAEVDVFYQELLERLRVVPRR